MMLLEFKNFLPLLNGRPIFGGALSLTLDAGEGLLISGPSGSGKTTLLRAILGFVPFEGELVLKGVSYDFKTIHRARRFFGYVPQNVNVLEGKVEDAISEIVGRKKLSLVFDILRKLFLDETVLKKDYSQLSGGEKQRVLLAIAVALEREVLILDEPTSFLDEPLKEKVAFFVGDLNRSFIVVSHDPVWKNLKGIKTWSPR